MIISLNTQKNRLKIISNFTGSAGIAVILKKKLFTDEDTQFKVKSSQESFKIINYENN